MDGWADSIAPCVWVAEQCVGRGRAGRERRQDWDGVDEFFRDAPPLEIEARHVLGGGGAKAKPGGGVEFRVPWVPMRLPWSPWVPIGLSRAREHIRGQAELRTTSKRFDSITSHELYPIPSGWVSSQPLHDIPPALPAPRS